MVTCCRSSNGLGEQIYDAFFLSAPLSRPPVLFNMRNGVHNEHLHPGHYHKHGHNGGLYTPPLFPGGLQADSIGLNLSRMPIFEVFTLPPFFRADSGRTPSDSTYPEC